MRAQKSKNITADARAICGLYGRQVNPQIVSGVLGSGNRMARRLKRRREKGGS